MDEIQFLFADMPTSIRSYVIANDDATYTIVLNSKLNREQNILSAYHEFMHIKNQDYERNTDVGMIELMSHGI